MNDRDHDTVDAVDDGDDVDADGVVRGRCHHAVNGDGDDARQLLKQTVFDYEDYGSAQFQ